MKNSNYIIKYNKTKLEENIKIKKYLEITNRIRDNKSFDFNKNKNIIKKINKSLNIKKLYKNIKPKKIKIDDDIMKKIDYLFKLVNLTVKNISRKKVALKLENLIPKNKTLNKIFYDKNKNCLKKTFLNEYYNKIGLNSNNNKLKMICQDILFEINDWIEILKEFHTNKKIEEIKKLKNQYFINLNKLNTVKNNNLKEISKSYIKGDYFFNKKLEVLTNKKFLDNFELFNYNFNISNEIEKFENKFGDLSQLNVKIKNQSFILNKIISQL